MIKLIPEEHSEIFSVAVICIKDKSIDARFFKDPCTGNVDVVVEDIEDLPFGENVTLYLSDGHDSYYHGSFDKVSGLFTTVGLV